MERKLTAILAADVVGYSRLIRADEEGTIMALRELREELIDPKIDTHQGRIVKLMGDGILVEFASIVNAVACSADVQREMELRSAKRPEIQQIVLRIGINLGDVVIDGDDIQGDGVNVAARLEALSEPGGMCISDAAHEQVRDRLDLKFEDLGEQDVKNIDRPVRAWAWSASSAGTAPVGSAQGTTLPLPDKPSIAVLPFTNMSDDPDQAYFSDGITESIINGLAKFREILVIGVKSILVVREQDYNLREIGRALGVVHIVEGSVRKIGDRVRVTAQLVNATNGQRLWAEHYDRNLEDIFAVQDEVTNVIVATLAGQIEHLELHREESTLSKDIVAYDCLLKGRKNLNLYSEEGELEARRHFERAIEIDPNYAAAYAGLAISYIHEFEANWSNGYESALGHADTFAQKAVTLDDADSQALYAISSVCYYRGQYEMAKAHVEKALKLNPNDYHIICNKGYFLAFSDQTSESITCSNEAMRLNPLTPENCLFSIGVAEYVAGRYKEALVSFGKTKGWGLHRPALIAACYAQLGRDAQAQIAAAEVWALAPSDPSVPKENDKERWRAYWSRIMKFENPDDLERFLDGLRKARLPA